MKKELPLLRDIKKIVWETDGNNPSHHLWKNRDGNWYMLLTVHLKSNQIERLRFSLRVKDEQKAIKKRDSTINAILTALAREPIST